MPVVTPSGEPPFGDDEWDALARGDAEAQNRLIAHLAPKMRAKFEAGIHSRDLAVDAQHETFRRIFAFLQGGHGHQDEASLLLLIDTASSHVIKEVQRAEARFAETLRAHGDPS
jgi:hypothetical protein